MKLLLCEGKEDKAVIEGLCSHAKVSGVVIEPYNGRGNLERVVNTLSIRPEFTRKEVETLAVLIDAEEDGNASFRKVQNAIRQGFNIVVEAPGIFGGERPRVAGFIISDASGQRGMLEDLCLESVSDRPDYKCMQEYFGCLCERTAQKKYHPKAKFKAWMASQAEYDFRVGLAAGKGYLPWGSEAFNKVREFLKSL
jgi:hypothetical protein